MRLWSLGCICRAHYGDRRQLLPSAATVPEAGSMLGVPLYGAGTVDSEREHGERGKVKRVELTRARSQHETMLV